jgi:phospholipase C
MRFRLLLLFVSVLLITPEIYAITPPGLEKIQHFIFIMQENRSFDHYFGTYPGADGIPPNVCLYDPGIQDCVKPYHDTNDVNVGGPHDWDNAVEDINNGRMDHFIIWLIKESTVCPGLIRIVFPGQQET